MDKVRILSGKILSVLIHRICHPVFGERGNDRIPGRGRKERQKRNRLQPGEQPGAVGSAEATPVQIPVNLRKKGHIPIAGIWPFAVLSPLLFLFGAGRFFQVVKGVPAAVAGRVAQFFFDAHQLIVLGQPVRAGQ